MTINKCLICASPSHSQDSAYHKKCLRALFETEQEPILDTSLNEISSLAKRSVESQLTIPGVQSKLSLELQTQALEAPKLTIVALWGGYILKPPSKQWPELPANEHCTMQMAEALGMATVPFGLIKLKSGELSYISRRIDRSAGKKFAMEDMCQLSGRQTEDKYKGSHEQIARIVKQYTSNPLLDVLRLYKLIVFSLICGNSDMHLKNFSLFNDPKIGWMLSPAYDLLSTRLIIDERLDPEQLALTLGGKKRNINQKALLAFGLNIGLSDKQISNVHEQLHQKALVLEKIIENSFLSSEMKDAYQKTMRDNLRLI